MDPYKPCWCGSGRKWKWCHKDRQKQKPEPIGKLIDEMRTKFSEGYCSHPNAAENTCRGAIVRAHTVQRRIGLAAISEDGHVLSVKAGADSTYKNDGRLEPQLAGVGRATTFNGFCAAHDEEMFRPVETGSPILSDTSVFLLSFRAVAYELFTKRAALKCIPLQRELDRGKDFDTQEEIQSYVYYSAKGMEYGLKDLVQLKRKFDDTFLNGNYDSFSFYAIEFDCVLPVVACGAFHPEVSFDGRQLQELGSESIDPDMIAFNLTVLNGRSVAAFGWLGAWSGPNAAFVESLSLVPSE
jgi:hypothetical protein